MKAIGDAEVVLRGKSVGMAKSQKTKRTCGNSKAQIDSADWVCKRLWRNLGLD